MLRKQQSGRSHRPANRGRHPSRDQIKPHENAIGKTLTPLPTAASVSTSQYTSSRQNLRIIPFGGLEEVGANMTVFEYGDDIIIVDMGFAFPDETTPGVDYIIPNTQWLEENKKR